ncbi:MAG: glycosyltransferase family 4 protein [Candidatus Dormibacteraeota bacterium]|nr:glycosyltransferase family 4 protein [Candidatus Dormibacteraeota bacterium]
MAGDFLRIVVPRFGAGVVGGSEGLMRRLATQLAGRGWRIEVWATTADDEATWSGELPEREAMDGYEVRRFRVRGRRSPRAFHQASRALFRLPRAVRPEALWLRAQGPYAPSLVAALAGAEGPTLFTPYLYYTTIYGLPASPHPRLMIPAAHDERPLRLASVGRALAAADALWFGTPEEQELVECVHPAVAGRANAIGTVGVDDRPPGDAGRFRRRFGIDGPFLFYGGRSATGKGLELLLDGYRELSARMPAARLVVAGAGLPPVPKTVMTTGRLDDEAWRDAIAAAAAVVIPSSMESLSLLALDAWSAGRPCVVNAESQVLRGQVARSNGGIIFNGAADLARQLHELLSKRELADRLGASGRDYVVREYHWDNVIDRLRALIATGARR